VSTSLHASDGTHAIAGRRKVHCRFRLPLWEACRRLRRSVGMIDGSAARSGAKPLLHKARPCSSMALLIRHSERSLRSEESLFDLRAGKLYAARREVADGAVCSGTGINRLPHKLSRDQTSRITGKISGRLDVCLLM
jgi:hypothetical protein